VIISYDLNYRDSLWKSIGGKKRAQEVNRRIAPFVDVMLGNEEDFSAALGYNVLGTDEHLSAIDPENFKKMITNVVQDFPFKVVATTLRNATTATRNDRGAICYAEGTFYQARNRENLEILDRGGRRFICFRAYLRFPCGERPAMGCRVRRGTRSVGDDHSGRHDDDDAR
jgi:2-dehydro-3-deoxygluconokinase